MNWSKLAMTIAALSMWPTWVLADWNPGDDHKMHYPQLPDPNGWDVSFASSSPYLLADDWMCSRTGPVQDVHLWISFKEDALPADIQDLGQISVEIYSNQPGAGGAPGTPGAHLWGQGVPKGKYTVREYGTGDQGWLQPGINADNSYVRPDHHKYFQINIRDIADPFLQQKGQVYWLAIDISSFFGPKGVGWKTSGEQQFMSPAVAGTPILWKYLKDQNNSPLDLAFVITGVPEPSTQVILMLGATGFGAFSRFRVARAFPATV